MLCRTLALSVNALQIITAIAATRINFTELEGDIVPINSLVFFSIFHDNIFVLLFSTTIPTQFTHFR